MKDEGKFDGRIGLLTIFARLINPSDTNEMGLTISIHGTIVSGMMIGTKRYYQEIGKILNDSVKGSSPEETTLAKQGIKEIFDTLTSPESLKALDADDFKFNHIFFMRNVKIYNGDKVIPFTGTTYWIQKIESIDGFFIGMIHPLEAAHSLPVN